MQSALNIPHVIQSETFDQRHLDLKQWQKRSWTYYRLQVSPGESIQQQIYSPTAIPLFSFDLKFLRHGRLEKHAPWWSRIMSVVACLFTSAIIGAPAPQWLSSRPQSVNQLVIFIVTLMYEPGLKNPHPLGLKSVRHKAVLFRMFLNYWHPVINLRFARAF